jgi:hypothetical protein
MLGDAGMPTHLFLILILYLSHMDCLAVDIAPSWEHLITS